MTDLPASKTADRGRQNVKAFSLVEVVLALAVCSFALVVLMGMLSVGLTSGKESKEELQAANLASLVVSQRRNAPTNTLSAAVLPSLNQPLPVVPATTYVDLAGQKNATAAGSAFQISYRAGTNAASPGVALVYLRFTWPPQAPAATAPGRYELATQVLMP
jgi:uncharacterized protein (TIGR02598 family)